MQLIDEMLRAGWDFYPDNYSKNSVVLVQIIRSSPPPLYNTKILVFQNYDPSPSFRDVINE